MNSVGSSQILLEKKNDRILVVMWMEAFRGACGMRSVIAVGVTMRPDLSKKFPAKCWERKNQFYCTPLSFRIQRALSASHQKRLIAPMEEAGFDVDIVLTSHGCPRFTSNLRHFYSSSSFDEASVVRKERVILTNISSSSHPHHEFSRRRAFNYLALAYRQAVDAGKPYLRVIMFRYDLLPSIPIALAGGLSIKETIESQNYPGFDPWGNLTGYFTSQGDTAYNFPAWYVPCFCKREVESEEHYRSNICDVYSDEECLVALRDRGINPDFKLIRNHHSSEVFGSVSIYRGSVGRIHENFADATYNSFSGDPWDLCNDLQAHFTYNQSKTDSLACRFPELVNQACHAGRACVGDSAAALEAYMDAFAAGMEEELQDQAIGGQRENIINLPAMRNGHARKRNNIEVSSSEGMAYASSLLAELLKRNGSASALNCSNYR